MGYNFSIVSFASLQDYNVTYGQPKCLRHQPKPFKRQNQMQMHHKSLTALCLSKVVRRKRARLVNVELLKLVKKRRYLLLADLAQLF